MDKPLCKLCGHKHAGVDHVWDNKPGATVEVRKPKSKNARAKAGTFDRTKYQREYMRKRRANK